MNLLADSVSHRVAGIDFTSRPTRRKSITVALGRREADRMLFERIEAHVDFDSLRRWLRTPGPWVAAFDFPFGLPRELVETLAWPTAWHALMQHYQTLSRAEIRATFAAFCAARPAGAKFAHRGCDAPAGSSSPMKWINPPVPHLHPGDARRVALEGYPGLLARELIGRRSYKSDTRAQQNGARAAARAELIGALERGRSRLGIALVLDAAQRAELVADAAGDRLDAVLCLVQAAWAAAQPNHGLPHALDPIEGWIVTTPRA